MAWRNWSGPAGAVSSWCPRRAGVWNPRSLVRGHAGFSLLELLVVILLLGLISAIAFPTFTNANNNLRRDQVESDVHITSDRVIDRLTMAHDRNQDISAMSAVSILESEDRTTVTLHGKPNAWWAVKGVNEAVDACFIYYSFTRELAPCADSEAPIAH